MDLVDYCYLLLVIIVKGVIFQGYLTNTFT